MAQGPSLLALATVLLIGVALRSQVIAQQCSAEISQDDHAEPSTCGSDNDAIPLTELASFHSPGSAAPAASQPAVPDSSSDGGGAHGQHVSALHADMVQMHGVLMSLREQLAAAGQAVEGLQRAVLEQESALRQMEAKHARLGGPSLPPAAPVLPPSLIRVDAISGASGSTAGGRTLLRARSRGWLDYFLMLAAVQVGSARVTAGAFLTTELAHATGERPPNWLAIGDGQGGVTVFNTRGDLAAEYSTGTSSAITCISSFAVRKGEAVLVTGHVSGEVRMHRVALAGGGEEGERHATLHLSLRHVVAPGQGRAPIDPAQPPPEHAAPIAHVHAYRSSSRANAVRMVAVWDTTGRLRVLRENATVRYDIATNRTALAASANGPTIVSLSARGTHVINSVSRGGSGRYMECLHLNGTYMVAATFDLARAHRAYAVSSAGTLLTLAVPHEGRGSMCKVLRARALMLPVDSAAPSSTASSGTGGVDEPPQLAAVASIRGYLLAAGPQGGILHNVTSLRGVPQEVLSELHARLAGSIMPEASAAPDAPPATAALPPADPPVLFASRVGGLVGLSLGGGLVVVLEASPAALPVPPNLAEGAALAGNKSMWMQPIFVGAMVLVGLWQFFKARNRTGREGLYGGPSATRLGAMGAGLGMGGLGALGAGMGGMGGMGGGLGGGHKGGMGGMGMGNRFGGGMGAGMSLHEEEEADVDAFGAWIPPGQGLRGGGGAARRSGAARDPTTQYGGFAGPRSVRRAMRMGMPPINDDGEEGAGGDDNGEDGYVAAAATAGAAAGFAQQAGRQGGDSEYE